MGVIEQLETKAEAEAARGKGAVIRRGLTSIATPATTLAPTDANAVHLLALHASGFDGAS